MKTIINSSTGAFPGIDVVDKPWFIVSFSFKLNNITQYITIDEWLFDNFSGDNFFNGISDQALIGLYDNHIQ